MAWELLDAMARMLRIDLSPSSHDFPARSSPFSPKVEPSLPCGRRKGLMANATCLVGRHVLAGMTLLAILAVAPSVRAQVTPAEGHTAADDTPVVKVGGTIFANFTYLEQPKILDVDGNQVNASSFDITRAYINVTGSIHHLVSYRITPDILRETAAGLNVNGSLVIRLKYAYGQFNLDDSWSKGSWVRLGLQQTPYIDYDESIYRYRFQGPTFTDVEKYLTSSDFGLSLHYNFPGNFGDVHGGIYDGDGYTKADANDEKALQLRVSFRPVPNGGIIKGLRLTAFYDADHYANNDDRTRLVGNMSFEHRYVNAAVEYLDAHDQPNAAAPDVHGEGYSVWVTPRSTIGIEGLLRYDSLKRNADVDERTERRVAGIAYWFPIQKPAAVSLMLDYEFVTFDDPARPSEIRYALHSLFNF